MSNEYYVHPDDLFIDRKNKNWPTKVLVYDSEGNLLHKFDKPISDNNIIDAICFSNKTYRIGFDRGRQDKLDELYAVLGLSIEKNKKCEFINFCKRKIE